MTNDIPTIRPPVLRYLCLSSLIVGLSWIFMLVALILSAELGKVTASLFPGLVIDYLKGGYLFVITLLILTGLGIAGVFLMWQMKKAGFYLYATAKTTLYFLPVIIIHSNHLTFTGLMFTSTGIIAYGSLFTKRKTNT